MDFFIQNFKAQTFKSVLLTIAITSLVVYLYWGLQALQDVISIGILWDKEYLFSFFPFFMEIVVYTLGLVFLVSRKGWLHGLLLGLLLVALVVVPEFIKYMLRPDGSLTLLVAVVITIYNVLRIAVPAALLSHFRKV